MTSQVIQPAATKISTCPGCGSAIEKELSDGLGCMVCLLQVGIGSEPHQPEELATHSFEDDANFGVYEIERAEDGTFCELGHGAMGVTYRAIDRVLKRNVALKVIKNSAIARSLKTRRRFLTEARAAAALRHENIATVFQFGIREETGQCFYAMELIEGETLEERVHRDGPLDARTIIDIAQQVTSAITATAKERVIHCDLKPANLMLISPDHAMTTTSASRNGCDGRRGVLIKALRYYTSRKAIERSGTRPTVKIIDFGLAKALDTRADPIRLTPDSFVGTPAFASPEQFANSALDVRSDIYSLGATLWFALTGKAPFAGPGIAEIRHAQQSSALPWKRLEAARVPSQLRSLIKSMIALEPAARPSTCDVAWRLHRCAAQAARKGLRGCLATAQIM